MLPVARPRLVRTASLALALAAVHLPAAVAWGQSGIRTPEGLDGKHPAVLDRITAGELDDALLAFAISADGLQAALASESAAKNDHTDLQLFSTTLDGPRSARVPGRVRDLLFATDGSVLYAILHRAAKRTGGDTHLALIDPQTLKMKRANRLPIGATDLDHWVTARALLIAAPAEIRTLLLPDLRSGPLFSVTGANRAVASLGGTSLLLVGQENGLDLIDLEDRPGIEEMPVREHLRTAGPVAGLAAATDGESALVRLADGSLFALELHPLRIRPAGSGTAVAAPPVATAIRMSARRPEDPPAKTTVLSEPDVPDEPVTPPADTPPAPVDTAPTAVPIVEPTPTDSTPPEVPEPEKPTTPSAPKRQAPSPPSPPVKTPPQARTTAPPEPAVKPDGARPVPPQPSRAAGSSTRLEAQLSGRITGAAANLVQFVVLRGPDNLLREAARITPAADGSYRADGLASGRYRIQLDGGGGRVLVSKPPYAIVDVREGQPVAAPDIEVVREF